MAEQALCSETLAAVHGGDDGSMSDEELSVGGTTPPPPSHEADADEEQSVKEEVDEMNDDDDDVKESAVVPALKFSIDNILNPQFGPNRMNPSAAATSPSLLSALYPLPFLEAAARQMLRQAAVSAASVSATKGDFYGQLISAVSSPEASRVDYHLQPAQAASAAAHQIGLLSHPTLGLVQSCSDKYLLSAAKNDHQATGPKNWRPAPATNGQLATAANNKLNKKSLANFSASAIDLSVRQSPLHIGKPSSPSLASSASDETSVSASPTRSASVAGSASSSVGNGAGDSSSGGQQQASGGASSGDGGKDSVQTLWPAWVYCTRYSDRPSSGPRARRIRKKDRKAEEKRPRTAFTAEQLARLKNEFTENRYLTEKRRQDLARELHLHENQIKIWFQNKRAKIKKASGQKNPLALQLMAQGLYNHSTMAMDEDEDDEENQE